MVFSVVEGDVGLVDPNGESLATVSGADGPELAVREQNLDNNGYIRNSSHNYGQYNSSWFPFALDEQHRLKVAVESSPHTLSGTDHIGQLSDGQIPDYITRDSELTALSGSLQDEIDNHEHDDRYYTETELDTGQLDNRYYTEGELLTGGVLDDRYYTESEIDSQVLRKANVDHKHAENDVINLDKYTRNEVDAVGENLQAQIDNTPFIHNGDVYFVDSTRDNKELGVAIIDVGCGRNKSSVSNKYLKSYDGALMDKTGIVLPYDATLVGITLSTKSNGTWTAEVRKNGSPDAKDSLSVINNTRNYSFDKNTDFNVGDSIQVYLNGTKISYPQVRIFFRRRLKR